MLGSYICQQESHGGERAEKSGWMGLDGGPSWQANERARRPS